MMNMAMRGAALLWALLVLAGCAGAGEQSPAVALPLAKDGPTFLFFFTDP
jgi:ABC-type glycerol-3-phosphate transport system substrate-binding protein